MKDERGTNNVKRENYQCGENEIPGRAESEVRAKKGMIGKQGKSERTWYH